MGKFYPSNDINGDYIVRGNYDPILSELSDIVAFENYLSKEVNRLKLNENDTSNMVFMMDSLLQMRFYHGTARYNLADNWLAYYMGHFLWDDFRMMVVPDQILNKKVAACNQISIVFHTLLKRHQIDFRPVGLNNHMVTEVKFNGKWHIFDPDYEPKLDHQMNVENLLENRSQFKLIYQETNGRLFNKSFDKILSTKSALYYEKNVLIGMNLRVFQQLTSFLSKYCWLLFVITGIILHLRK